MMIYTTAYDILGKRLKEDSYTPAIRPYIQKLSHLLSSSTSISRQKTLFSHLPKMDFNFFFFANGKALKCKQ